MNSTVLIVGLGGAGSWIAEALCRSGIGNFIFIDMDEICISNINRQIHALTSTIGKFKIQELEKRLLDINPDCSVTLLLDFINSDNALDMLESLDQEITICIDAIDKKTKKRL